MQIAESVDGRRRIVRHVGSAREEAELGLLLAQARDLLADDLQGVVDLGMQVPQRVTRIAPARRRADALRRAGTLATSRAKVLRTSSRTLYDALGCVFDQLGFAALGDACFRDLVIARVVEPTSLLDVDRVLADLGRAAASLSTRKRTLRRAQCGDYRDQIAAACFAHASSVGDVSLVLYDVTVRHEALVVRMEVRVSRPGFIRGSQLALRPSVGSQSDRSRVERSSRRWRYQSDGVLR